MQHKLKGKNMATGLEDEKLLEELPRCLHGLMTEQLLQLNIHPRHFVSRRF